MKTRIFALASLALILAACGPSKDYSWEEDLQHRLAYDFSWTRDQVKEYIQKYIPDVSDEQIDAWTVNGPLESMEIDGQLMYFNRTAAGLFRVDSTCRAIKEAAQQKAAEVYLSGASANDNDNSLEINNFQEILSESDSTGRAVAAGKPMKIRYTITVKADAVPEGEIVRCWLPYPRTDMRRQKGVKLLATSEKKYKLADVKAPHSSLYMQKKAVAGEPTVFWEEFECTFCGEHNDLEGVRALPYDKKSDLWKRFTAEQAPHIVFSDRLRAMSDSLGRGIKNPIDKAKAYFLWIDANIPWSGAREYSTLDCIPEYVLDNMHGDCGQQTLLFMTLCRIAGIPCRWQSGLTVEPSGWNMHDWCEVYFEGIGWVPVDATHGIPSYADQYPELKWFNFGGVDSYRWVVNSEWGKPLQPRKIYPRSETVDFQRGEVEWKGGNLYFDQWRGSMDIEHLDKE